MIKREIYIFLIILYYSLEQVRIELIETTHLGHMWNWSED